MKYLTTFVLGVFLCLGAWHTVFAEEQLVIAGTGDSQVLLRKMAVLFEKEYSSVDVVIPDSVGSGGGIKALVKRSCDLARTARPLKPKESTHGFSQISFALSPIVFVSHSSLTGVENITMEQVIAIYQGKISNWKDLGGDDHKIYPVDREPGDSSRKVLEKKLITTTQTFKDVESVGKIFLTTPETVDAISINPYTFGFLPLSTALEKELFIFSLDNVSPLHSSDTTESYPLFTTLYLVKPEKVSKAAESFLTFIRGDAVKKMLFSSGVTPIE